MRWAAYPPLAGDVEVKELDVRHREIDLRDRLDLAY